MNKNSSQKLHMIGNAHIDPVWLWQWQEGFHEVKATFKSVLDRMNESDDFTFISSSAAFYAWIEESDPRMFEEIRERIAQGRWQLVGGWWIQPDCNIPCGESFVRQGLYGQRYFMDKFGRIARVGYNVDSFGHSAMLPQILKKSGLDYYVFLRPHPHEKGLPGRLFWWEAEDGSRVLAYRIPYEYCTWGKDLEKHVDRCTAELKAPFNQGMCFYGVGNHGGGPTKENIESIRRLNGDDQRPALEFSTPDRFFQEQEKQNLPIPTVHDDLQHHGSGCYSAHSGIKRWNRKSENLLLTAEKFSAVAEQVTGQPYPQDLDKAWKAVLFNQFHDILAGTCVEEAYDEARDLYGEANSIAARALNLALQSLSWNIHIDPQEGEKNQWRPFVVFNPHTWPVKSLVEVELLYLHEEDILIDSNGKRVPYQRIQPHATAKGPVRVAFIAELPALGYTVYRFLPGEAKPQATGLDASDTHMESGRFRLELNQESGAIRRLFDKKFECEVFSGEAARAVVLHDTSDTWGHNVFKFDQIAGEFQAASLKLVEHGPVRSVIRVTSTFGSSKLIQDFCMYPDLDQIDVRVTVDWREDFKMLKLRFPLNLMFMRAVHEIPYGHIERFANGEEEPGGSWVDLSGVNRDSGLPYGLSLLNDGKYSLDVNIRDIGLTVLRSPVYANHLPIIPEVDGHYSFLDQGIQRFNYSLLPHEGSWEKAGTVRKAAELNAQPVILPATFHTGKLALQSSFACVEEENLVVSVLKKAEDGDALIVRCYETSKTAGPATIHLPFLGRTIRADFGPAEIKTFRVPLDADRPVTETNFLEWELTDSSAS